MKQSMGDAVALLDGDLQDPPELIDDFVKKWMEGYDVVYGSRINRETSKIMNFSYKFFYRIFNKLSYLEIPLDAGDFSLMDRKVVDSINSLNESDRFIRGLRAWTGFKQIGVPYSRPERLFGKSTNNLFRNIQWAKKGIFSFSYLPLEIISFFSYLIVLISCIGLIIYTILYFIKDETPKGITTLIVLVLFLGGMQLLSISILSEYIGKILEETKKRPNYIIKKILNNRKKNKK
jgi:dolichol-phosphate mannosyltransferase